MQNDPSPNDPRTIWQNQPTEPSIMTLEVIRQKTRELHAKTRRALFGRMVMPLVIVFLAASGARFHIPGLLTVFAFAIAWSLAGLYFVNRGMWSATLPGEAASGTGLDSYRREVERRRYLYGRFLMWTLGPLVLAIATFTLPLVIIGIKRGVLLNMIPFLALLIIWIVGIFVVRTRDRRELQHEIDELSNIERANG
jgi:hypothetical protein